MPRPIEDYALLGDTQTAALVGNDGSIDWLCLPRFDSAACFAALLGEPSHGRWLLAPSVPIRSVRRRYLPGTLILETEFDTDSGTVRVIETMPPRDGTPDLLRIVEGVSGNVPMRFELIIRFDYGQIIPWVRQVEGGLLAVAGPDALCLRSPVPTHGEDLTTVARFEVKPGQRLPFVLSWFPSHLPTPKAFDPEVELSDSIHWWENWSRKCTYEGPYREPVLRSLITLKALTYAPTGGLVAAPTTSLPEQLGGVRNWDYRYCWLRDATLTLYSLMLGGFEEEAQAWRNWLLRAVAGDVAQMQVMYGPGGERRLTELQLSGLPGYRGALPVRIGNAAVSQLQLDVLGEVMDSLYQARRLGIGGDGPSWSFQRALCHWLADKNWEQPDEGIWEVRGPRRHFTHSKVMAWVAMDRAVRSVEQYGLPGDAERWRKVRDQIHEQVCDRGFDAKLGTFTQSYGSKQLDASLLMIPIVGFLPPDDPRVVGTVAAIEAGLCVDGFVRRYTPDPKGAVDGLPPGEGVFLACTFWLADNYALLGRVDEAEELFERLLSLRNDVGLLAEEYDPLKRKMLGNFPQAFSHVALVNTALNLSQQMGPSDHRPCSLLPPQGLLHP
jgi:GH15 family glucan-1,4-alpha-glucosidase